MNLNNEMMIPQQRSILDNQFPSFDNLMFHVPKAAKQDEFNPNNLENKQTQMKLQVIEEKLKNLEKKNGLLDTINKNVVNPYDIELEEYIPIERNITRKNSARKTVMEQPSPIRTSFKTSVPVIAQDDTVKILKDIKDEITKQLADDAIKNRETYSTMNNEFKEFRSDIWNRLDNMEIRQKMQLESIKYVLENSGSSRVKNLSQRVLSEEYFDIEKMKNKYARPDYSNNEPNSIRRGTNLNNDASPIRRGTVLNEANSIRRGTIANEPNGNRRATVLLGSIRESPSKHNSIRSPTIKSPSRDSVFRKNTITSPLRDITKKSTFKDSPSGSLIALKNDTNADKKSIFNFKPNLFPEENKITEDMEEELDDGESPRVKHKYVKNKK